MRQKLTNEEARYRLSRGLHCWDCKSDEVDYHAEMIEVNNHEVIIPMSCLDCHASWEEVFILDSYQNMKL